jgi:hypothetical protein
MGRWLANSIRQSFESKTNEELLAIWTTNDLVQWSTDAIDVARSLLTERGVVLPAQHAAITSYPDPDPLKVRNESGRSRYARATGIDIIISMVLPGWGVLVGLIALAKGEKRRAMTMITIGLIVFAILAVSSQLG